MQLKYIFFIILLCLKAFSYASAGETQPRRGCHQIFKTFKPSTADKNLASFDKDHKTQPSEESGVPSKQEEQGYPLFLQSPRNPSYEDLMASDLSSLTKNRLQSNRVQSWYSDIFRIKSFQNILKLFTFVDADAEYIFVGNGMYIPYLMAKSIFDGTAMQPRIKFMAVSRKLADEMFERPSSFDRYFKFLEIGEHQGRAIMVIDSMTSYKPNGANSLIKISRVLRGYLLKKGWEFRSAMDAVVPLTIIEQEFGHRHRSLRMTDFLKKSNEINKKNWKSEDTFFPYLDSGLDFAEAPFRASYNYKGDSHHYWNGKYRFFDILGLPEGDLSTIKNKDILEERLQKALFYKQIIAKGQSYREIHQFQVAEILQAHQLTTQSDSQSHSVSR